MEKQYFNIVTEKGLMPAEVYLRIEYKGIKMVLHQLPTLSRWRVSEYYTGQMISKSRDEYKAIMKAITKLDINHEAATLKIEKAKKINP